MIDSGEAKNQAELARIKSISRAKVAQILNLTYSLSLRIIIYTRNADYTEIKLPIVLRRS